MSTSFYTYECVCAMALCKRIDASFFFYTKKIIIIIHINALLNTYEWMCAVALFIHMIFLYI